MKLRSFGCSFIYGIELSSTSHSWPALMAEKLELEYVCHARPGAGNLQITEAVLQNISHDDIFIINWTWIDRFDFVNPNTEKWKTLRPSLDHKHAGYYFQHLHSQYRDMLTNLIYIKTAVNCLRETNRKFIMTAMDNLLFEPVHEGWHDPNAVLCLQNYIKPFIKDFEGNNFLDWSRVNGFPVSNTWHPLQDAHVAAAEFWLPSVKNLIHNIS